MKIFTLVLLPLALGAQPAIRTELRNGVTRAVVLHRSGDAVTDELPAQPGETLTVQGSGFGPDAQILIAGSPVDAAAIDEATAQFTLPPGAGGSFLEIAVAGGNAASLPVD